MWSYYFIFLIGITLATAGRGFGGRHGGTHTYPTSRGYSGAGSGGTHAYPQSTGLSGGTNAYPHSPGLSGNSHNYVQKTYNPQHTGNYGHKTEIHNHYHYNPPQRITYGSTYHPVYHAAPPVYVYEYRDSGSRFNTLLAGLALYNLGRMSASHSNYDSRREYRGSPGEICKLGISKQNGDYEETRIDCKLMSSFIWEAEIGGKRQQVVSTNTVTTTTVNVTSNSNGNAAGGASNNSTVTTTVTFQNKTVVDALQVKGPSIKVTPGMNCFMIRISRDSSVLKKTVECGLLQTYAQSSLHNGGGRTTARMVIILLPLITYCL